MALDDKQLKDEALNRKSSKKRSRIKAAVIVLIIVLVAIVALFVFELLGNSGSQANITSDIEVPADVEVEDGTLNATAITEVPPIASLFGKTTDEAISLLGEGADLKSVTDSADEALASVKKVAVVAVPSNEVMSSDEAAPSAADLYLSLDEADKVCKAYYQVPLANLGNADMAFGNLLDNEEFIQNVLEAAGVDTRKLALKTPAEKEYQVFDEADANKIKSEAYTYKGERSTKDAPTTWELRFVFDYSQVNITGNPADLTRTMYLTLY